ncbi:hypothetical protein BDM02DRAFT_3189688 [Thelephora ganbajun]|uniref:Uncharacterized protein n=1 Tax=Thelephora ganbajun TaxID=370292 RepID=A0ACB6Z7F0_THEGA|nr:hypothetical protein BDM02DRAFT_3189688 [Thelephora ganbajun]
MPHYATSTLTADDKRRIISALQPSTSHIFAMARGQIYHAPFTATSSSEWKPLDLRGAIIFGRDTREYEIRDDASSRNSSLGSLRSAGASGTSRSSGVTGFAGAMSEEPGSMPVVGEVDRVVDLAGGLRVRGDDDLWFRLVEIDPQQKKPAKVVWRQPVLPANSDYKMLVPFFHAFSGNSRMFGFRFEDDDEAYQFYETVMVRTKARPLVKPSSGPRSWSKTVRRRATITFTPTINQITDPEPGSFQHKAHVGIDEKGNIVAEGEVDRKWTDFLSGPIRPKLQRSSTLFGSRRLKKYLHD